MLDIKNVVLVPRELQAAQFTGDNWQEMQAWIQGVLAFHQVTANEERLYLPGPGGVEVLEPGDWVLFDPRDTYFRGATDDAIVNFYEAVEEVTPHTEGE